MLEREALIKVLVYRVFEKELGMLVSSESSFDYALDRP
jgi:hypothetical protein